MKYVAAAIQCASGADKRENLDKAEAHVEEAARLQAQLVVLPEVFLWRGPMASEAVEAEIIPGEVTRRLASLAQKLKIHLIAGSILESVAEPEEARVFNTSLLIDDKGETLAVYRKIHLFDVDLPGNVSIRESDTRRPGHEVVNTPTSLGVVGMSVCYDLRFPELYRRMTMEGAQVLAIPSCFTFSTGSAHWEPLLRARAIENQSYVIAANQLGEGGGILAYGNSMIVDPWGKILACAPDREAVICAEIDLDEQRRIRRELPCLDHIRIQE